MQWNGVRPNPDRPAPLRSLMEALQTNAEPDGRAIALQQEREALERQRRLGIPGYDRPTFTDQFTAPINDEIAWLTGYGTQALGNVGRNITGQPVEVSALDRARAMRQISNEGQDQFVEDYPVQAFTGGVLGGAAMAPARGAAIPGLLGRLGTEAGLGAAYGAAEGDSLADRLSGAGFGAGVGLALGGAAELAAPYIGRLVNRVRGRGGSEALGVPALTNQTEAEAALARYRAAYPDATDARVLSPGDEGYPTNAQWDEVSQTYVEPVAPEWARYVTESRSLPQISALAQYEPPSVAQMQRFGRVERVPLSQARASQNRMDWDRVNSGFRSGDLVEGYGDKPLAIRREDGEYVLMDGHHRTVRAIEAGDLDAEMYVIDARDFAPEIAGRAPKKYDSQEIDDLFAELSGPVEPDYPIRAYHGSPHSFDRFSLDKIGTGEGAQAYGHGLYFAESEDVARQYRDTLSGKLDNPLDRRGVDSAWVAAARDFRNNGYSPAQIEEALGQIYRTAEPQQISAAVRMSDPGSMYEVGINADPNTFLDWDRPVRQQPELVRDALASLGYRSDVPSYASYGDDQQALLDALMRENSEFPNPSGSDVYKTLSQGRPIGFDANGNAIFDDEAAITARNPRRAADALREAGISGIRYLDANSRGVGEGSRNYVLFNDELVKILRKYGISGLSTTVGASALAEELDRRGQTQEF